MDKSEDVPEAALDPAARDIFLWIAKGLWWIIYPITIGVYYLVFYLSLALVFVIKLLYQPLVFILAPILYLIQFLWACFLAPFQFAARFETLYIYLSIAALVGLTIGLLVNLLYTTLQKPLGLDPNQQQHPSSSAHSNSTNNHQTPGRTAKQYRQSKRAQKQAPVPPSLLAQAPLSPSYGASLSDGMRKGKRGGGLNAQTILEELDSDY